MYIRSQMSYGMWYFPVLYNGMLVDRMVLQNQIIGIVIDDCDSAKLSLTD